MHPGSVGVRCRFVFAFSVFSFSILNSKKMDAAPVNAARIVAAAGSAGDRPRHVLLRGMPISV